ncbi:unnamed protein product [Taenia asiatica]|uniref:Uncharacterized protein n=1 Tax=Taenia asiatica TaxID=60517 RepID=A0A3P6NNL0_TAEAS|nr:unnamed protein product [Taenia asiatica]
MYAEVKSEQDSNAVIPSLAANLAIWKVTLTANSLNAPSLGRDVAGVRRRQDLVVLATYIPTIPHGSTSAL